MKKLLALLALLVFYPPADAQTPVPPGFPMGVWPNYTPTFVFTGGTGVSNAAGNQSFLQVGKTLILQVSFQVVYTTAPTSMTVSLPNGLLSKAGGSFNCANQSSQLLCTAFVTTNGSVVTINLSTLAASSSVISITGPIQVQ